MNTIDKLSYITNLLFSKIDDNEIDLSKEEFVNIVNFSKDIKKDLRRLEKLKNIIKEIEENINSTYDISMIIWYKATGINKLLEVFKCN